MIKATTCSDCAEIVTITRMDTTLSEHTKLLDKIDKKLDKSPHYTNSFFGGMITTAVLIGGLLIQVAQPIVKPLVKVAIALLAK